MLFHDTQSKYGKYKNGGRIGDWLINLRSWNDKYKCWRRTEKHRYPTDPRGLVF